MKRYHEELPRTRRNHRLHLRNVHNWPEEPVHCICDLQAGRFRKSHALSCGNKNCHICKYEKIYKIPSTRDRRMKGKAKADLREYFQESGGDPSAKPRK